jgi:ABC-type transporter Mla subunit MlaD
MSNFEKKLKERTQKIDAKLAQLDQNVSKTLQETQELGKEIKSFAEKNRQTKVKKLAKLQNEDK